MEIKSKLIDKFVRYAKIDTQSDPKSKTFPSTLKQFDLANLLVSELKQIGIQNAFVDENCYVWANVESNSDKSDLPNIGFVCHMDTAPDFTGKGVNPQIIESYQGQDIKLGDTNFYIKFNENPALKNCIGHTIIHTDGLTLLGSDDKSGVTAIMTMAELLMKNPDIIHGNVKICFTPDEEIGKGADRFDLVKFDCEYAYTIDGEMPGELNKETFSADTAIIRTFGRDIHPGSAKNIMVNSMRAMAEIITKLPKNMAPETTEGYEPYIHPHKLEATVPKSELLVLLRDFKTEGLTTQKEYLEKIISEVQQNYKDTVIELEIIKIYRNMLDNLEENPKGLDYLFEAADMAGVSPFWNPIRGGTDGSRLTEIGLPTPNIFTGGQNFHSNTEWLSVDSLVKSVETMINLVQIWEKNS